MSENKDTLTRDGNHLVSQWLLSRTALQRAYSAFVTAKTNELESRTKLAEWILPSDAKLGEKIAVWNGDSLFEAQKTDGEPIVTIRTRGRSVSMQGN